MFLWQPVAGAAYPPCVDGDYDITVVGQCTGNPLYAGEQDNDPAAATDCAANSIPGIQPLAIPEPAVISISGSPPVPAIHRAGDDNCRTAGHGRAAARSGRLSATA
jgi:hypothetical protein